MVHTKRYPFVDCKVFFHFNWQKVFNNKRENTISSSCLINRLHIPFYYPFLFPLINVSFSSQITEMLFTSVTIGPITPKTSFKSLGLGSKRPKDENASDLGSALRALSDQRKKNEALVQGRIL